MGQPGQERDAPAEVHSLPLLREAAADDHVDDLLRRQLGNLVERRPEGEGGEVIGAGVDERALGRTADRRACSGDDHGFWHG